MRRVTEPWADQDSFLVGFDLYLGWSKARLRASQERAMAEILVVDDDVVVATFVQRVLEGDGHQVRVAGDGQIGLEMVAEARPDLIVLDLDMPRMGGLDVCFRLK